MSLGKDRVEKRINDLKKSASLNELELRLKNKAAPSSEIFLGVPTLGLYSKDGQIERLKFLKEKTGENIPFLEGSSTFNSHQQLEGNIENFIGMTQVPTGIIGPLLVHGTCAKGDFYLPLATTEGALVASYNRGAKATKLAGGITSVCLIEGVQRSPLFRFENVIEVGKFVFWILEQQHQFVELVEASSNFAQLEDVKTNIEGNEVILTFEYTTGDAAGQNMVTICTNKICEYILNESSIKPVRWFIESNYSGDKKATALSFSNVRGKKVTTEINIPRNIVQDVLKSTPELMVEYWKSSTLAVIQSGAIGAQGHVANGLAALFLSCGQDVACISEAATGITRMQMNDSGGLYCAVTLPNLIVGTIGGGTGLGTQKECLKMIGCYGKGTSKKFAEICGALALAGELSIAAAMSAGHFTQAHQELGRKNGK